MKHIALIKMVKNNLLLTSIGSVLLITIITIAIDEIVAHAGTEDETITVYKSPTCGCCTKWVDHLTDNGFKVKSINTNNLSNIKKNSGLPYGLGSCHTAFVDGYVIEGHVPASDIKKLLKQRLDVVGLTVPGMPMGSPGMEGPRRDKYDVMTFDKSGKTTVFSRH